MKNWHWFDTVYALGVMGLTAIAIAFGIRDCTAQSRCESLGGRVEKYDCQTVWTTVSCGSDCTMILPVETCKWRCVGAPAER